MDPMLLLLGALFLNGRKPASSAPSSAPSTNGHSSNGHSSNGQVQLQAGRSYRFVGTLANEAPTTAEIRELLKLVAATGVRIRRADRNAVPTVQFDVRMPLDMPFVPGTTHPQAPWLQLQQVAELESQSKAGQRAVPSKKTRRRPRK